MNDSEFPVGLSGIGGIGLQLGGLGNGSGSPRGSNGSPRGAIGSPRDNNNKAPSVGSQSTPRRSSVGSNSVRDTTLTRVFVGGLPWTTESEALYSYFSKFGTIVEAIVIKDRRTGRSKGYGFVTFEDVAHAASATADPSPIIDGRKANCNLAVLGAKKKKAGGTTQAARIRSGGSSRKSGSDAYSEDERVVLNVGGTIFETTRTTLNRFPDSLIPMLLQPGNEHLVHRGQGGEIFFDRNGRAFEWVLDVYRHGCLIGRDDINSNLLQEELAFFGLEGVATNRHQRFDLGELSLSIHAQRCDSALKSIIDSLDTLLVAAAHDGTRTTTVKLAPFSPSNVWWYDQDGRRMQFQSTAACETQSVEGETLLRALSNRVKSRYGLVDCKTSSVALFSEFRTTDYVPFFFLRGTEAVGLNVECVFFSAEES